MSEMDVPVSNMNVPHSRSFVGSETDVKLGKKKGEKKIRKLRYAFQTRSQVNMLTQFPKKKKMFVWLKN
jgi:hypothetical protein